MTTQTLISDFDTEFASCSSDLARCLCYRKFVKKLSEINLPLAKDYAGKYVNLAQDINSVNDLIIAHSQRGIINGFIGAHAEALDDINLSLLYAKELSDYPDQAGLLELLGSIYFRALLSTEAIENYQKAADIYAAQGNTKQLWMAQSNFAAAYGQAGMFDKALGILENLAKALHAATGCSKPVSDMGWRPHHEHVGQTGLAIAPNLYFAIGISGSIQHLAGVNRSKVIVVINKDPEAPFFKAADYGIVGDAFEVMPKIIAAVKKLKAVT